MATGEVKISALPLDTAPTADDYVATVDVGTSTTKKVPLGELSQALDKAQLLSTDADNLLTTGTDDNLRLDVDNDIVSSDAGNILQKGTDGKLLAPSVALSLTEDRMFIGGASNTPEEKTDLEVRSFLGLPTDYIKDDIQYVSANQVSWEGKCRDSSDSRDFEIVGATTASLVAPTADTTYNLFVASNTLTDAPVIVWDTGSTPAGYTYYRRVLSIVTDGIGNIPAFTIYESKAEINVLFNTEVSLSTTIGDVGTLTPAFKTFIGYIRARRDSATGVGTLEVTNKNNGIKYGVVTSAFCDALLNLTDFIVTNVNGDVEVSLNSNNTVSLFIQLGFKDIR